MGNEIRLEMGSHRAANNTARPLFTLTKLIDWIRAQEFDTYTAEGLIALAKRYPEPALPKFKENIQHHVGKVRAKRRQEMKEKKNEG